MNTPAHAILSLLVLSREDRPENNVPILVGALLPDAPIVAFYAYQKLWQGQPEEWIWSQGYFEPAWQAFFDLPNSLPLILLGLGIAAAFRSPWLVMLPASMALHVAGDLPLHHDDGHRHFFPLSDWRFESPVSYWDPSHYGQFFAPLESVLVIVGGLILFRRYESRPAKGLIGAIIALYGLQWIYAVVVWL